MKVRVWPWWMAAALALPTMSLAAPVALPAPAGAPSPAGPGAAAQDASEPTTFFEAVWSQWGRHGAIPYRYPAVVRLLEPEAAAKVTAGQHKLRLRIVREFTAAVEKSAPQDVTVDVSVNPTMRLFLEPGKDHYLAMLFNLPMGRQKQPWRIMPMWRARGQGPNGQVTQESCYLLPVENPAGPLPEAISELIMGHDAAGKPVDKFDRMLEYVKSADRQTRDFASSFAAVNGMGFTDADKDAAALADRFTQALLAAEDPVTRRRLARAFSTAGADLLPRRGELLERLLAHADDELVTRALRDNLGHAGKRGPQLVGLLRPYLTGPAKDPLRRSFVLKSLAGWGGGALVLRPELEAIARGEKAPAASGEDRLIALRVLLDGDVEGGEELVARTLVEVPSAVALEYAVKRDLRATVPSVIEAVRAGRLAWTEPHSAALSMLSWRNPGGSFQEFDRWWTEIEKAGRTRAMLADGFVDLQTDQRARKLIRQLGSRLYETRLAAREALRRLPMPLPPALRAATEDPDLEIAVSAAELVAAAENTFKSCRDLLTAQAAAERAGAVNLKTPTTVRTTPPAGDAE